MTQPARTSKCTDYSCGQHGVEGDTFDPARHCWICFGAARHPGMAEKLGRKPLFSMWLAEQPDRPAPPPPAPPAPDTEPCFYRGRELTGPERMARGLDHAKAWALCDHPKKPLGEAVCPCMGCGPACPGYREESLPPAVAKMVLPRDLRPHIWRGGVLQIWTTRACDRSCYGCTQGSNLAGKPGFITPDQFKIAVDSLTDYFGVVGIFGGNPAIHPQFDDLCTILRGAIPWEQRGLWCNHPKGKGATARITFNPAVSNLNVHESQEAWDEFSRDWPECRPFLKGLDSDSRHAPPFVAMQDVIPDEAERWKLIQDCDVNRNWSAMICVFRGELRGFFCELAAAQAMLHQDEPDYPDTGVPITPGWWKQGMKAFEHQVRKHCHECGVPLRGHGALANGGPCEQVSATHAGIYRPKRAGRPVEMVTDLIQLGSPLQRATDYIENGAIQ